MKPPFSRRNYLVRPFQYRLILFQASYFALIVGVSYFSGLAPLLTAVEDQGLSADERAKSAQVLIYFHQNVLPFLAPLLLVLFAHSVVVSHRIAGPLFRFLSVLRAMAAGDLSMNVRIRGRDYLHEEARVLDEAVVRLRQRITAARAQASTIDQALGQLGSGLPEPLAATLREARTAAAGLKAGLDAFVLGPLESSGNGAERPPSSREAA